MKKKDKESYQFLLRLDSAAGIDVHKETFKVAVCRERSAPIEKEFGTFTKDLYSVRDFLQAEQIQDVILESTGVYWRPLYRVLMEGGLKVTVANPLRVKQIPMEKTDKKDARWLAKLLMNDMVKPSFIASGKQEQLRELTRMRTKYVRQMTRTKNQVIRLLESCNFKIRNIVSDISTKTAQRLIDAISEGQWDVDILIVLCHHSVRKRQGDDKLKLALEGRLSSGGQQQLKMLIDDWRYFEKQKQKTDVMLKELFTAEQQQMIRKLDEVEGIATEQAEIVMAEIGAGIESFANADKAAKYAGLTPGQCESADKKKQVKAVPGNKYLRVVMVQVAWSAVKVKNGYWMAEYQHLKKRIGGKKAILAIARRMFKAIYKILTQQYSYQRWDAKRFIDNRIKIMAWKKAAIA